MDDASLHGEQDGELTSVVHETCRECGETLEAGLTLTINPELNTLTYRRKNGTIAHVHTPKEVLQARGRAGGKSGARSKAKDLGEAVLKAMYPNGVKGEEAEAVEQMVHKLAAVAASGKTHSVNAVKLLAAWAGKSTEVPKPADGEPCPVCGRLGNYPVIVDVGADIRALAANGSAASDVQGLNASR
jgi:hypothetical protein